MTAAAAPRSRWLYGPFWDLMLGCGGLYLLIFAGLWGAGPGILLVLTPGLVPLMHLVSAVPHYGATLLRVYENRKDRRAYFFFSVWATIVVWAAFVVGVYDVRLGNWIVTLFLTWSPWHYSGQNYGIGLMLLGRAGVSVTPVAKRFVWASFFLSWLLVVFATHAALPGGTYTPTPAASLAESAYHFVPLGIPIEVVSPLLVGTALAYLASLIGMFFLLRREASWSDLAPMIGVVALQAAWFSIPVLARATGQFQGSVALGTDFQGYVLLWNALGHSLQYLWVTTYYATASKSDASRLRYWSKAILAGAAIFGVPVFLFSPDVLGVYAFEAGLGVLVSAAVNLHHFLLDGAIWKLRDGRIARILLRRAEAPPEPGAPLVPARSWIRSLVWGTAGLAGVAYVVFSVVGALEIEYGFRRAMDPPDAARMRLASERLARVGHAHPTLHLNLGILAMREGELEEALRQAQRSLELAPSVDAWLLMGQIHLRGQRPADARAAFEGALALDAAHVGALSQVAAASLQLGDFEGAERALARALVVAPERRDLRRRLAQVRRRKAEAETVPSPAARDAPAATPLETPGPARS